MENFKSEAPAQKTALPLDSLAQKLCEPASLETLGAPGAPGAPMPDPVLLRELMSRLQAAIFPGYFGKRLTRQSLPFHMAANLDSIYNMLSAQTAAGLCFGCGSSTDQACGSCENRGEAIAAAFMEKLPELRKLLTGDARAAFEGDPAAVSPAETIFCYPSLTAMFHHRIAHALYLLGAPFIPRIISEMAHSATGIDIHPGAAIGEDFFIDHGTGVVIGETAIIGKNCRIYQGVTLGALSFPKNPNGTLTKGVLRHPILEDDVTVYANATILGRVTIGKGAIIGGNVWITEDVKPGTRITQERRHA